MVYEKDTLKTLFLDFMRLIPVFWNPKIKAALLNLHNFS